MVRIFWIAIAILIAATAAAFLFPTKDAPAPTLTSTPADTASQTSAPTQPRTAPRETPPAEPTPAPQTVASPAEPQPGTPTSQPPTEPAPEPETETPAQPPADITLQTDMPEGADGPQAASPTPGPGQPITSEPDTDPDQPAAPSHNQPTTNQELAKNTDNSPATPSDQPATNNTVADATEDAPPAADADDSASSQADSEPTVATADDQSPDTPASSANNEPTTDDSTETTATANAEADAETEIDSVPADTDTDPSPAPAVAVTPREKPTQPDTKPANKPAADPVVKTDTGLLLDGRWEVEGKGTKDSPYEIEWDMLVALQRDYKPRLGQTEIPAWIEAIDGMTVTIRGYALLPMGMSSLSELLVMLNQWDSCCIGVPPTPFDAIEVRLAENLSPSAQSMFSHTGALSYGDITGTFKIDPYIVQGYLLGLYLMEDAKANLLGPAGTP